jgi:carbon storage regulator CsrA
LLVLSRRNREAVVVGGATGFERMLKVTVLEINHGKVRLGFEIDKDVPVHRWEVWERICAETPAAPGRNGALNAPVNMDNKRPTINGYDDLT